VPNWVSFIQHFLSKNTHKLFLLWVFSVFIICFIPSQQLAKLSLSISDILVHCLLFIPGSLLLSIRWQHQAHHLIKAFLASSAIAVATELLQGCLTFLGRSFSFYDILADMGGALLGLFCYRLILSIKK
jgi:VanZ family protein